MRATDRPFERATLISQPSRVRAQIEPNVRSSFECFLTLGDNPAYAHGLIYRGTARSSRPTSWAVRQLPRGRGFSLAGLSRAGLRATGSMAVCYGSES